MNTPQKPRRKRSTKQQTLVIITETSDGRLNVSLKFKPTVAGNAPTTPSVEAGILILGAMTGNAEAVRELGFRFSK